LPPETDRRQDLNRLIALFGEEMKVANRAEKREDLKSVLFDVPLRSVLGWKILHDVVPDSLREIFEQTTPEALGQGMRRIGSRPYGLQIFFLVAGYMLTREQERINAGIGSDDHWPDEKPEDVELVISSWERISRAYRSDDFLLPGQAGGVLPILDDGVIATVVEQLRPPSEELYAKARRMFASVELCSFVMHGEQRDGIGGHGPYRLDDGRTLFFKEINDLRNDYLPWARTENRNIDDNLVLAFAVRPGVDVRCDMFGSMLVQPHDFDRLVDGMAVIVGEDDGFSVVEQDRFAEIEAAATAMQQELYLNAIEWDDRYRIEYAGPLYANHVRPFQRLAGLDADASDRLLKRCEAIAAAAVDDLMENKPTIWAHMGGTEGPMMAPLRAGAK
jgi:hypothetical protein